MVATSVLVEQHTGAALVALVVSYKESNNQSRKGKCKVVLFNQQVYECIRFLNCIVQSNRATCTRTRYLQHYSKVTCSCNLTLRHLTQLNVTCTCNVTCSVTCSLHALLAANPKIRHIFKHFLSFLLIQVIAVEEAGAMEVDMLSKLSKQFLFML